MNIRFWGLGLIISIATIRAPRTGTKARSSSATTPAGSAPENQTATRPASHSPATSATKRSVGAGAPVQFGTAVRKKPPSAALAKPKTISCACQAMGPGAKGSSAAPAVHSSQTAMAATA